MKWYTIKDLEGKGKAEVTAMALMNWGNCSLENPPEGFGEFMVEVGDILGIVPTPENFMAYAKQFVGDAK